MKRTVRIQAKQWLCKSIFRLDLRIPGLKVLPGQFFQIRVGDTYDPFLNRPISIADYDRGMLSFIIEVKGRGTEMLSRGKTGDPVTLFGPYGKGIAPRPRPSVIVAGGIGIAPLLFLARHLRRLRARYVVVYGTRTPDEMILKASIKRDAAESHFICECGSKPIGTALDALRSMDLGPFRALYVCGPRAMLKALQGMDLPLPAFAFCEDYFGCGFGLCLGCAIKYRGAYRRVCSDGPVFDLKGIEFEN